MGGGLDGEKKFDRMEMLHDYKRTNSQIFIVIVSVVTLFGSLKAKQPKMYTYDLVCTVWALPM